MTDVTSTTIYPTETHLIDLYHRASPGIAITGEDGKVVLSNPAAQLLLESSVLDGGDLVAALGLHDHAAVRANKPVGYVPVSFTNSVFETGFAAVGFGTVSGNQYGFWALRPTTSNPIPQPDFVESDAATSGRAWADAVAEKASASEPGGDHLTVALIKGFYDYCPVGIHLIEADGTVAYANREDIAIVGASQSPTDYVGHHIRGAYADQEIVDDFLTRWDDNDAIIDFRANFLNRTDGSEVPVVIFSTARVENGTLHNTRCFVFSDDSPSKPRDRVSGLRLDPL